jgi:hypothetical protein
MFSEKNKISLEMEPMEALNKVMNYLEKKKGYLVSGIFLGIIPISSNESIITLAILL